MPVLTTILCGALLVALALNVAPFLEGNSTWGQRFGVDSWSPDKPFLHIPSLVLSTGSLLALMTFVRERKKMQVDRAWSRSEVVLREAKAGLDEVLGLLRNQNNDRVIWVRAARSLVEAQRLGTSQEQLSRQLVRDHRSKMPWSHHAFAWHVRVNLTPSLVDHSDRPTPGKTEKQ